MRRRSAWAAASLLACAAGVAAAAEKDRPTAAEAPLMRAAGACLDLGNDGEPARSRLLASGWQRGTPPEGFAASAKPRGPAPEFYANGLDGVLLTFDPAGCMFNIAVPRELKMRRLVRILANAFQADAVSVGQFDAMWSLPGDQAAMAHHQRTRNEASVQLIVTSSRKKKK